MTNFVISGGFPVDADGFAPPPFGGTVAVKYGTVTFADTTAKPLFTLPQGAIPVLFMVNVVTAFDSDGTDLLDVGIVGTAEAFAANLDVSTVGQKLTGFDDDVLFVPLEADTTVTATYAAGGSAATAGSAVVAVFYIQGAV